MAKRICPKCGHVDDEDFLFCPECGAKVSESAASKPGKIKPGIVGIIVGAIALIACVA